MLLPPPPAPVYADEHLLAFDKPAGLLAVPGRGPDKADCLSARVQAVWPGALIVHRLDETTSGLILMARSPRVQRLLGEAFAQRRVRKRYEAVVGASAAAVAAAFAAAFTASQPGADEQADEWADEWAQEQEAEKDETAALSAALSATLSAVSAPPGWAAIGLPLLPDWPRRPRSKVDHAHGKPSLTLWRPAGGGPLPGTARVALRPITGRSHQLRVHLAAIGLPIAGDALYAPPAAQALAPRLLLHASALQLTHPVTGKPLRLASRTQHFDALFPQA
ncbi:hypothetical protein ADJ79_03405 [Ottowia sp. oral taxon 894]|uniref:RluA family pseudouridine synthase n=1 Tax=Ottowia sp. oral taxon 894 TaxID=1658672 RepID=UPI0006820DDF|nr:RluA family pseudouridine synthase [Ottowia sp. oral taxon 894]AKU66519.1 hypothetical protein ADJ79_03405 [Ottowia sp. oral taxon 894]